MGQSRCLAKVTDCKSATSGIIDINNNAEGYAVSATINTESYIATPDLIFVDNTNNTGTMKDQIDIAPNFNRCPKPGCGGGSGSEGPQGVSKGKSGLGEGAPGVEGYEAGRRLNHMMHKNNNKEETKQIPSTSL